MGLQRRRTGDAGRYVARTHRGEDCQIVHVSASSHAPVVRILLVDDEPVVLMSLRETLRPEGYTIVVANSPDEALESARQHTFAVVVSDHQMPGMTGVELLTERSEERRVGKECKS